MIFVGTSGWQYEDWRGRFYPSDLPKKKWLEHFSAQFPTVEVNNTFYRLPGPETFVRWREGSADGFGFTIKASRFITHIRRLRDCGEPLRLLWSRCSGLRTKLGPVLFQLPPRFPAEPDRLRTFCTQLPKGMRAAFEFRDRSWETAEVFEILDEAGAAFVWADTPGARIPDVITGGWVYVRFHRGGRVRPGYSKVKLGRWADRLTSARAQETFVYFNNDTGGAAVHDARILTELLRTRVPDVRGPGKAA
jgi:uncharacterized protein YecE (DUF72 family)